MAKIKKGDQVIVIAGKEKGKQGTVLSVSNDRVKVEGLNLVKKHQKPNRATGAEGSVVTQEASLHISNVAFMLFYSATHSTSPSLILFTYILAINVIWNVVSYMHGPCLENNGSRLQICNLLYADLSDSLGFLCIRLLDILSLSYSYILQFYVMKLLYIPICLRIM